MSELTSTQNSNALESWEKLGIEKNVYSALKNSLYPGAKDESILMVLSYCKAAKLDPMLKPVHIVPMQVTDNSKPKVNGYHPSEFRDVIMPGIGLYRTQAERTGSYAGITEPEFGEDINAKLGKQGLEITYPKWCKVTVKKILKDGTIGEFTAKELWIENYATKGKDDPTAPNAMWLKRPYAQLAKCAEAQALRKAFPELGSQPTAEEMEGKQFDVAEIDTIKPNLANILENKLNSNASSKEIQSASNNINEGDLVQQIEDLNKKINACQSAAEIENLLNEINQIKKFSDKKNLMEAYKAKFAEFEKAETEKTVKEFFNES